ncbi:hypothetical protein Tco_0822750 [Tanacetum coccineum]|uniref:Uncharacterized protein n=1 Tax=Tanacetum coccineum TaxID=301880 RepID=A0ABQ5AFX9_9ASTR
MMQMGGSCYRLKMENAISSLVSDIVFTSRKQPFNVVYDVLKITPFYQGFPMSLCICSSSDLHARNRASAYVTIDLFDLRWNNKKTQSSSLSKTGNKRTK